MSYPDEYEPGGRRQLSGLDAMFANTNIVVLIIFGFCCGYVALVLGIVGIVVCQDPRAKQNAMIVTLISAILSVLWTIGGIMNAVLHH